MSRAGAFAAVAAGAGLLGSCVTVYEDAPLIESDLSRPDFAVAQTIPLGAAANPDERALYELYAGVLQRLQEAAKARDVQAMEALLGSYQREGLPPWLRDRLDGYRLHAAGLAFQQHAAAKATVALVAPPPGAAEAAPGATAPPAVAPPSYLGEPLRFEFALPAAAVPVRLGGRNDDDPTGFAVAITIEDSYVDGGRREQKDQDFVWLDAPIDLAGDAVLRLPIALDVPGGDAVQRTVHLRIDLMPGFLLIGGERALVRRAPVAAMTLTQWPAGYERIAAQPLASLQKALRAGDAANFPVLWLAAVFTAGDDREQALGLLVDQVRHGSQTAAMVAMAALRAATGVEITIGDREAWLAWWQMRR